MCRGGCRKQLAALRRPGRLKGGGRPGGSPCFPGTYCVVGLALSRSTSMLLFDLYNSARKIFYRKGTYSSKGLTQGHAKGEPDLKSETALMDREEADLSPGASGGAVRRGLGFLWALCLSDSYRSMKAETGWDCCVHTPSIAPSSELRTKKKKRPFKHSNQPVNEGRK